MSLAPEYVDIGTFIDQREGYRGGRPFIVGTGITVDAISSLYRIDGWDVQKIAYEYDITLPQAMAALAFYLANQETIDAELETMEREFDRLAAEHRAEHGSVLDKIRARLGE